MKTNVSNAVKQLLRIGVLLLGIGLSVAQGYDCIVDTNGDNVGDGSSGA